MLCLSVVWTVDVRIPYVFVVVVVAPSCFEGLGDVTLWNVVVWGSVLNGEKNSSGAEGEVERNVWKRVGCGGRGRRRAGAETETPPPCPSTSTDGLIGSPLCLHCHSHQHVSSLLINLYSADELCLKKRFILHRNL